ncbi:hypothetical protein [Leptolyngbya sp. 7M]|uniref:hypothetical protein n=1 Tax=Leptolyngbya sp. 7M TaxID=2812896 RepID=UPI001B8C1808|nr:hypothetical protein [Leptolyngbya sp. 7M]QYO63982.1 hypothetical protein JVX88_29990 [Leptolyngbya sp. 7M]
MEHYLNFNLSNEPHRFHVSLPWSNLHTVNFNAIDAHLKSVVPEAITIAPLNLKASIPITGSDKHRPITTLR